MFERKIPAVALVTAPQYLLALRDADTVTHVDLDAMVKQVESFRDLLDAFDATDTAAFGPVGLALGVREVLGATSVDADFVESQEIVLCAFINRGRLIKAHSTWVTCRE